MQKKQLNYKDPFVIRGIALIVLGVGFGGAVGGAVGALAGGSLITLADKPHLSQSKKALFGVLLTVGGAALYYAIVFLILSAL